MADRDETVISRETSKGPVGPQNAKERFYEKLRMPIRLLDGIIAVLVIALIIILVIGFIKGHS